ncbi:MAG TPA: DUF2207 domain-containing protein, partial [Nitriliruptoraceae bacterium]|nr:DUF2207 domain-containing protein [Nitriliruptoraceae bacterium]
MRGLALRRAAPWLLAAMVSVAMLAGLAEAAHAQGGPWDVSDYDVEITINDDSTLTIVEDITVDFSAQQRGIFRYWDVVESLPDPLPAESTIQLDGDPGDYQRVIDIDVGDVTSSTGAP